MKVTLHLEEEHLKLIPFIRIKDENDENLEIDKVRMLTLQSTLTEDVSLILGWRGLAVPHTENDENGRAFPEEIEKKMMDIYNYVRENLYYIEILIHQFVVNGGITVGTYTCDSNALVWEKVD